MLMLGRDNADPLPGSAVHSGRNQSSRPFLGDSQYEQHGQRRREANSG